MCTTTQLRKHCLCTLENAELWSMLPLLLIVSLSQHKGVLTSLLGARSLLIGHWHSAAQLFIQEPFWCQGREKKPLYPLPNLPGEAKSMLLNQSAVKPMANPLSLPLIYNGDVNLLLLLTQKPQHHMWNKRKKLLDLHLSGKVRSHQSQNNLEIRSGVPEPRQINPVKQKSDRAKESSVILHFYKAGKVLLLSFGTLP
uniref:Uncharacterized protein n=1 Tax=Opuntia streptacantha TaxID=393608 RepID=A0A7C9CM08_OPUST